MVGAVDVLFAVIVAVIFLRRGGIDVSSFPDDGLRGGPIPTANNLLQGATVDGEHILGPETVVASPNGTIFTISQDGWIYRKDATTFVQAMYMGGRPLGFAFAAENRMYVADAVGGLFDVDLDKRSATRVCATTDAGEVLRYIDDVDVAPNGVVYFSSATRYQVAVSPRGEVDELSAAYMTLLSGSKSGSLARYNPDTGACSVILPNLFFANGVAVSPDGRWVAVAESLGMRVRRVRTTDDASAGLSNVLVDALPGNPDGLAFGPSGLWVTFATPSSPLAPYIRDFAALRLLLSAMPTWLLTKASKPWGGVGLIRPLAGDISDLHTPWGMQLLDDESGAVVSGVTSVTEHDGVLSLGTLLGRGVATLPVPAALDGDEDVHPDPLPVVAATPSPVVWVDDVPVAAAEPAPQ